MEVTDIRLNLLNKDSAVKAIGSFSLDGVFAVRGVRIMEDKNGRNFVAFPSREKTNGEYEDLAFPLNKEFYHELTDAIIKEFNHVKEEKQTQDQKQAEERSNKQEAAQTESAPKKGKSR